MKIIKETNLIEVAEFANACDILNEPVFCWWVPYTLRKKDRIIASFTSSARNTSQKYGIEVLHDLYHAKQMDAINNNRLWQEAIELEISSVRVAFEILDTNQAVPIG